MNTIEITIPVLNEEKSIIQQIQKLHEYINETLQDIGKIKLVIADNGSTDATSRHALSLAQELADVEYFRLEERGVGRALKASWIKSTADIVGYMDLDLATDLTYIRPALEQLVLNHADIVAGSRLASGAIVIGRTRLRNFTSRCFNSIVRISFRTRFSDGMCGFKFLRRPILRHLMEFGAVSDGWFFATQLLVIGEYLNYRIYDLPVKWTDDPNSKVKIGKLSIEYLKEIFRLKKLLTTKRT